MGSVQRTAAGQSEGFNVSQEAKSKKDLKECMLYIIIYACMSSNIIYFAHVVPSGWHGV